MLNKSDQKSFMVTILKHLVETESPSHDKIAVDRVGAILADECRRLGAEVKIHPQQSTGDQVEARWGQGTGGLLLLCHMDTVFPVGTLSHMPFLELDGKLMGPGTQDMKGGIVVTLAAIAELVDSKRMPAKPFTTLFTSDEEIGSSTSRGLIEKLAGQSGLVLVLEPAMPDGSLKTWRKGVGDLVITVRGRAAHAGGDHEKGRNAIEELAHQVLVIQKLTDYTRGTTLNVGLIHGGIATNVVPDEAVAEVDFRVLEPGEADRIISAIYGLKPVLEGTTIKVSGGLNRPPMPSDQLMRSTFEKAQKIAASHGIELEASGTGGASDANFVAPLGIPVLDGLGPIGDGEHSEREFIFADSLSERADLLVALLREW